MRLSVIIPGYENPAWRWRRVVNSVLACLGAEDEIICVDDGSRNLTLPQFKNPQVKEVRLERNGGLAWARNNGIAQSSAKYVAFVDSDDEVMNDVFNRTIARMEETSSDVGIFGVLVDWFEEGLYKEDRAEDKTFGQLSAEDVKYLSEKRLLNYMCNKVYSRAFLDGAAGGLRVDLEGMPCEDIIFNLNVVMKGARWCSVDCLGYRYYHTTHSLVAAYKPSNLVGQTHCREAWRAYRSFDPRAAELLATKGEIDEAGLLQLEWKNIWRSTMSIREKYAWQKSHPGLGGVGAFVKMGVFSFFRNHCYVRPIRRWHIRRNNPTAKSK